MDDGDNVAEMSGILKGRDNVSDTVADNDMDEVGGDEGDSGVSNGYDEDDDVPIDVDYGFSVSEGEDVGVNERDAVEDHDYVGERIGAVEIAMHGGNNSDGDSDCANDNVVLYDQL